VKTIFDPSGDQAISLLSKELFVSGVCLLPSSYMKIISVDKTGADVNAKLLILCDTISRHPGNPASVAAASRSGNTRRKLKVSRPHPIVFFIVIIAASYFLTGSTSSFEA
jgi:hypothetical protein